MPLRAWTASATVAAFAALGSPSVALAADSGLEPGPAGLAATPPLPAPGPRSTALAVTVEALSPLGGAGCFYRGRVLTGVIVVATSLLGSSMLLYGLHGGDRDAAIIGAVTYGLMRSVGVAGAARMETPASPGPAGLLTPSARMMSLSYGVSF